MKRTTGTSVLEKEDRTVRSATEVLTGTSKKTGLARLLPFLGPAFIASVAYMDPGNFATNIQGGARFGYLLLWIIGELVAIATDLAEFLGAALGFYLLFGMPLWVAGLITAVATFLILGLERYGFRPLEAVITAMVGVVAFSYLIETFIVKPHWPTIFFHAVVPQFAGTESVLLATGILGATVMPHVIYLHSALTQDRIIVRHPEQQNKLFRYELIDVFIAMGLAGLINMAMLIMAASTFFNAGLTEIGTIEEAHRTLEPPLGSTASWIFAISLLASGLSSSSVGTMAGQVIMQGFLHFHIPAWVRRVVTMFPSLIVIFLGLDPTRTLVISQVVLSFGLPFAIVPLIMFTSRRDIMGALVNRRITNIAASLAATLIIALNLFLLYQIFFGG